MQHLWLLHINLFHNLTEMMLEEISGYKSGQKLDFQSGPYILRFQDIIGVRSFEISNLPIILA